MDYKKLIEDAANKKKVVSKELQIIIDLEKKDKENKTINKSIVDTQIPIKTEKLVVTKQTEKFVLNEQKTETAKFNDNGNYINPYLSLFYNVTIW